MVKFTAKGTAKFSRKNRKSLRKTKKNIQQIVKQVVAKNIETKLNDVEQTGKAIYGVISNAEVYSLLPSIAHGTGEGNRIGNKIKCTHLSLRLSLYCYNQSSTTPPAYFDIYIFKCKNKQVGGGQPTSGDMSMFLEDGNSSKQYVGTALDGMRYLNEEMFTIIKKKRVVLYNPYSAALSQTASINPHRYYKFNLTNAVKNTWMFNDSNNTIENDNLYIAIGATLTSGATLPINTLFGDYSFIVQSKFKDA